MTEILTERGKTLEDLFFQRLEKEQLAKFQAENQKKADRRQLRVLTGVEDPQALDQLLGLGISPKSWAALMLVPLVDVAWADEKLQKGERAAILQAAEKHGIEKDTPAYGFLESWLTKKPEEGLVQAWQVYIDALRTMLPAQELKGIRIAVSNRARVVAEAAGGFLGLGNKISNSEQEVLDRIDRAFSST